ISGDSVLAISASSFRWRRGKSAALITTRRSLAASARSRTSLSKCSGCKRQQDALALPRREAIVQPCPHQIILHPAGDRRGRRADDARRDMTFIKIKIFDAGAQIVGDA